MKHLRCKILKDRPGKEFRAPETRQSQDQACSLKGLRDPGSTWRIYFFKLLPDKTAGFEADWPLTCPDILKAIGPS